MHGGALSVYEGVEGPLFFMSNPVAIHPSHKQIEVSLQKSTMRIKIYLRRGHVAFRLLLV
jgi:hypothetical protein